ncbi:putative strigolactone esterase D14 [Acorus calamus]|uniref:Strigolactone esterase D14 n=1 Tax=Acorus calamus TaxID=4465 RepID=A0AAV9EF63_ACOCL|nr:putative strigolactone esterase D14 [Acorus calamus]
MGVLEKAPAAGAVNARVLGGSAGDDDNTTTTILLAHGYGGDQSVWDYITPQLSESHRIVTFDWIFSAAAATRGDADDAPFDAEKYSSYEAFADELVSLIERMDLGPVVFVGHSMSGMVGCIASVKRPDLFRHLVLLGSSPRYLNSEDYKGGFEESEVKTLLHNIETNFKAWAHDFASVVVAGAHSAAAVAATDRYRAGLTGMRPEAALAVGRAIFLSDNRAVLGLVEVPCTVVQTNADAVVPMHVAEYMQGEMKAALEVVDCEGHVPHLMAPDLVVEVFERILGRV